MDRENLPKCAYQCRHILLEKSIWIVSPSQVLYWWKKRDDILAVSTNQLRLKGGGAKPQMDASDHVLVYLILQIRSLKLKVYREWIHVTARHLTHAEAHETFVASDKCLSFFMGRFEIMLRRMTNMTTLSDNELVLRAINYNFYLFTHRPTLHPSRTIFMDDTAVFFEDPRLKMSTLLEPDMSGSSQQGLLKCGSL